MNNKKYKYNTIEEIDYTTYYEPFLKKDDNNKIKVHAALERSWKNRDFEIDKYWSRATYFWAFIAASFTGFILVNNKSNINTSQFEEFPFIIASLGLVFSVAWYFVNKGSKKWQENWEKHIDLLEDYVTGPLYKTVLTDKGHSVSKINLKVSEFVCIVWFILWLKSMVPWDIKMELWEFSFWKLSICLTTIVFLYFMSKKHDKIKNKTTKTFSFRRRKIIT